MKTALKFVCLVVAVLVFSAAASAATFSFSNHVGIKISVTLTYFDADSGVLTTKGWWHVEPGGETAITVNADESRDVYYAAYNKNQYVDSVTRKNPQIRRWANPHNFTYTTDEEPYDVGAWHGRFYRIDGTSVSIDERS
ncbi:MAG: DUF1036 domain-containing protein [Synergistaceae bacterium]|nr:DUF1036 domain-containing protein [Synergistaceae bacterium]